MPHLANGFSSRNTPANSKYGSMQVETQLNTNSSFNLEGLRKILASLKLSGQSLLSLQMDLAKTGERKNKLSDRYLLKNK